VQLKKDLCKEKKISKNRMTIFPTNGANVVGVDVDNDDTYTIEANAATGEAHLIRPSDPTIMVWLSLHQDVRSSHSFVANRSSKLS
jgi:hypothetical protein